MEAGETTCNQLSMSSLGMRECLEAVRERGGWNEREAGRKPGHGVGVACGFFVSGAGYPIYRSRTPHCTVVIKLDEGGGGVLVQSGAAELGQGCETMMATIAAEALGVPLHLVRVRSGDSDLAMDLGAYSSRTTLMTGHATKQAAEDVKGQVLSCVAEAIGVPYEEISIEDGLVKVRGKPGPIEALREEFRKEHRGWRNPDGPYLTFLEASRFAFLQRGSIVGRGQYHPPLLGGSFKGATVGTSPAYGCSAQVAEVEVDLQTGQVRVVRVTAAPRLWSGYQSHPSRRADARVRVDGAW